MMTYGTNTNYRCIIQKPSETVRKFYPPVKRATVTERFPFACSTAKIEILSDLFSELGYYTPVSSGDIVRLQADVSYTVEEPAEYVDIFEGRVHAVQAALDKNRNNQVIVCRGHEEEAVYKNVKSNYSADGKNTGEILQDIQNSYFDRIAYDSAFVDTANSTTVNNYNTKGMTKYVGDVIRDMEMFEAYGYMFDVVPQYDDTTGVLENVFMKWQPVPESPNRLADVRQDRPDFLNANIESTLRNVVNDVVVYGDNSSSPQKQGSAEDTDSINTYGRRTHVQTDTTLATDNLCQQLAEAILQEHKDPIVSGRARISGNPYVRRGDLIKVDIPALIVDDDEVSGEYRVARVTHNIQENSWTTDIDLSGFVLDFEEVIADFHNRNRLNNAQFIL